MYVRKKKKMGSIEVYDAKQRKWVPYVPDYEKWRQHFHDIQEGYAKPDHMGRYVVGSGRRHRKLKEMEAQQRQKEIEMLEIGIARRSSGRDGQIEYGSREEGT